MSRLQLAPVAQGLSDFEAKVVTARLGADGILWELRGVVDSLYPLGGIDVLVPVDELDAARLSLLDQGGDDGAEAPGAPEPPAGPDPLADADAAAEPTGSGVGPGARRWWITAAVVVGLAAFSATRLVAAVAAFQDQRTEDCTASALAAAEGISVRCRR